MNEIKEAIKKLGKTNEEIYSVICSVEAVDEVKRTIKAKPKNGGAEIFNVRLQAFISGGVGLVLFPKLGSDVIVNFITKETAFVAVFSEVENFRLDVGTKSILVVDENIVFNGGEKGGLPVSGLVAERLNAIESDINALKNAFSGWVPVPHDGGAALKSASESWAGSALPTTSEDDINNLEILQ